jgi:hypothetical protein
MTSSSSTEQTTPVPLQSPKQCTQERENTFLFYDAIRDNHDDPVYADIRSPVVCNMHYQWVQEHCWGYNSTNPQTYMQELFRRLCELGSNLKPRFKPSSRKIRTPSPFLQRKYLLDAISFDTQGVPVRSTAAGQWSPSNSTGRQLVFTKEQQEKGDAIEVTLQLLVRGFLWDRRPLIIQPYTSGPDTCRHIPKSGSRPIAPTSCLLEPSQ